jgi:hypothetical protein
MPNYQQGKIYKIGNAVNDECYVGSTTLPLLCMRMAEHRNNYKCLKAGGKICHTSSYTLFDRYGVENCRIELLETVPCNTKDELTKREGHYIRLLNCVNRYIAGRTKQEWYEDNLGYFKKWCEDNSGYMKNYREVNRDKILEYSKNYREVNRDKIAEKYTCICGSIIRKNGKSSHEKSLKHMNYCASVASPCSIVK